MRGVLAVVLLALAWASIARTLGFMLRTANVERAHRLAPHDGRVTALLAQKLVRPDADGASRLRADQLARRALLQEPMAVVAAATLGLNAQLRGDVAGSRRLFNYAGRLSRRDLQTQVWAIEDAVARADIPAALQHYDIALRTSREAPDLLFPVLSSAIAEPSVRAVLVATMAQAPVWPGAFIDYVSGNGPDPLVTVQFFLKLRRAGVEIPPGAGATIVSTLIGKGRIAAAWRYYASMHRHADPRRSRDPDFAEQPITPSPFDWVTISDASVNTSIQRGTNGGVLDFSAPTSVGGPVVQQMQILPPGRYRLEGRSTGISQAPAALPYWVLTCGDGREAGRVTVQNSGADPKGDLFGGEVVVPSDCTTQTLRLILRASDKVDGVNGQIETVRLAPSA